MPQASFTSPLLGIDSSPSPISISMHIFLCSCHGNCGFLSRETDSLEHRRMDADNPGREAMGYVRTVAGV